MLSAKSFAQVSDTIFVYDTIKVYDHIKVEDSNIKDLQNKNNSIQNAVLAIDTATNKAQLVLYNKKDTATISINSILLSENLNNSDTMKKQILTLAAAALLAQTSFAQQKTDTTDVLTASVVVPPVSKAHAYSIQTVVFQNKKDPQKIDTITLPTLCGIRFYHYKDWKKFFPADSNARHILLKQANQQPIIITHIDDSLITLKYQKILTFKTGREYKQKCKKIREDETLSNIEKENAYFKLTYTDSVKVPIRLVKSIFVSKFNNKLGFNESIKHQNLSVICGSIPVCVLFTAIVFAPPAAAVSLIPYTLLGTYSLEVGSYRLASRKRTLNKWDIKIK